MNKISKNKQQNTTMFIAVMWAAMVLLLTGCIGQLPEDSANSASTDTVLAGDIERESNRVFANNIVSSANWNNQTGVLSIQGVGQLDDDDNLSVFNATTRQILLPTNQQFSTNNLNLRSDDNNWALRLNNLATVPCSVSVSTRRGVQRLPVLNAPLNCSGASIAPLGTINITQAQWKAASSRLSVKGGGALPNQVVSVFDSVTGQFLGSDTANSVGNWRIRVRNLFPVPCTVSASANGLITQSIVQNAPQNCTGVIGGVPVVPVGSFPVAAPVNGTIPLFGQAPESVIQAPLADLTIPVGTSINFIGFGFDPDGNGAVSYRWSFGGSVLLPDRYEQSPDVLFTTPGIYYVTLTVTDPTGLSDPTPATRLVIVQDILNNTPGSGTTIPGSIPPEGFIAEPAQQANIVVSPGQAITFRANGFDPDGGNIPLTYHWNFGGAAPNMVGQVPGPIVFNTPGTYLVSLVAIDSTGTADPTPDYRTITVLGTGVGTLPPGNNQAPSGKITSPLADQSIPVGGTVNFTASGYDPDNNAPLSYSWNFGGAAQPSNLQNPGQITFNSPGTYFVTMTVMDNFGLVDPTPEVRMITVGGTSTGGGVIGITNRPPESTITQPASDITVNVGNSVVFAGTGSDPEFDTQLIYQWAFDGAMPDTKVQNPGEVIFNQPGTYRVRLSVADSQGAVDLTPAVRTITVVGTTGGGQFNQAPNGVIIDPAINMTISAGQSLSFSALGTDPDNDPITYTWEFDGQMPSITGQVTQPVTFSRAGVYRVTLNVRDSRGARDTTPDVRMITVIGNSAVTAPVASIVSPPIDVTINVGDSLNFNGSATSTSTSTAQLSYSWNFGNATTSGANTNSTTPGLVTFSQAGVYPVTLTVSNGLASDTVTRKITVLNPFGTRPVASIAAPLTGVTNLQLGQSLQFSAVASGGVAPYSYMWDFDGATTDSSQQTTMVRFSRSGTFSVKVYATDALGNRSLASAPLNITVGNGGGFTSGLVPQIVMNPANTTAVAVGQTINFSSSGTGLGGTYRWTFGGAGPSAVVQNPGNFTFDRVGTYNVRLTVTDANGATSIPALATITVTANGGYFGGVPGTGTGGTTLNAVIINPANNTTSLSCGVPFNFTAQNLGAGVTYQWAFYQGNTQVLNRFSTTQNQSVTFNQAGAYSVALTATSSTGASDTTPDIKTFNVLSSSACSGAGANAGNGTGNGAGNGNGVGSGGVAAQAPNGNITSPASDITVRVGQTQTFNAESYDPSNSGALSYAWNFGNLPTTGLNMNALNAGTVTFSQQGVFVVRFTVTNSSGIQDPTPSIRVITVLP